MQSEKPKDTEDSGKGTDLASAGAKAVDIAIGLASLGVEAAEYAARYLAEKGPEWVADLEDRGRPVREKIVNAVRGEAPPPPLPEEKDEISALERRIRELEGVVGSSDSVTTVPTVPPIPSPPQTAIDVDDDAPHLPVAAVSAGLPVPAPPVAGTLAPVETTAVTALQPFVAPDIDDDDEEEEDAESQPDAKKDTSEGSV